ncbi:MAG: N-acetyl-gamma-glutamyl-phosphate reductase [Alphaproteobacteria bacterium]
MAAREIPVAILGASGYTGADLIRLLSIHPQVRLAALTAHSHAGKPLSAVFPHLRMVDAPDLVTVDDVDWSDIEAVFCALPHGTTQEIVAGLPKSLKVVDLSADFRLNDPDVYAETYGKPHAARDLQPEAVYGLTEHARDGVTKARLVACPGCYPTASLLALLPLIKGGTIQAEDIIIDAKSGVSGAGRGVKEANLFCEVGEGIHPYGIGRHRHAPEIEQELARRFHGPVAVNFTPHLIPMNRGELVTCYVRLTPGQTADSARAALKVAYDGEAYVHVLPENEAPATRHVRGSNHCVVNVFADRIEGRAIVIAAIDNLVKGSSGQAIQNFNLMMGLPETTALEQAPLFP